MHNDYPFAPEQIEINYDMLSDYWKEIAGKYGIKVDDVKKLVPNLNNKTKYVVHYRNLQLYLSLGVKLTKVHRVLKFKQSDWLKKCIDFNTNKRKNANNSFEKYFFKLMINSVYGKTMQNLRKRINIKLVYNVKYYIKYASKPSFISRRIFFKKSAAIHDIKPVLTFDKTIYVRFSVLELSKYFMYDFHYNYVKRKFGTKLLFTDTCSPTYEIKTDDVYEDFYKDKHLFDFRNYPKD